MAWSANATRHGTPIRYITGANSHQYTVQTADVGHRLRVAVTATNKDGSGNATSVTYQFESRPGGTAEPIFASGSLASCLVTPPLGNPPCLGQQFGGRLHRTLLQ